MRPPVTVGAVVVHKDNPLGAKGRVERMLPEAGSASVQWADHLTPQWIRTAYLIVQPEHDR